MQICPAHFYLCVYKYFLVEIFPMQRVKKAYSTKYSQAVTHPSTNLAQCCLTSVIGRELVLSTWYGRRHRTQYIQNVLIVMEILFLVCHPKCWRSSWVLPLSPSFFLQCCNYCSTIGSSGQLVVCKDCFIMYFPKNIYWTVNIQRN